ncbi:MAG: glycosyltransferase, TIGR04372 family protein [Spirochaetales bacterium]|nr:glycosyltransferase, TIGR04372 family protein [Spirochaetales bacterium]
MISVDRVKDKAYKSNFKGLKNRGRLIPIFQHQVRQLREKGISLLPIKCYKFILIVLQLLVVLPFIPLIRMLRPLVVMRFGQLNSDRIGHFAANTELYLCERDMGMYNRRTLDVFYHSSLICNHQLKKMWDRTLRVSRFARPIDMINRWLPGSESHVIPIPSDRDIHGLLPRTKVHLSFTSDEEHLGTRLLREMGIPANTPFVCFHARESIYLNSVQPYRDWSHHDYRNTNIDNCIDAVEELTHHGYYCVRMGSIVKEALNTDNPKIIDYAAKQRTEFLDIFLGAKCHFFIYSGPSGISEIPAIFRRPLVCANQIPIFFVPTIGHNVLFIPKKLWHKTEKRLITFREMVETGAWKFQRTKNYEEIDLEWIENTSEEISSLVLEMYESLNGTLQTTDEDDELQQRFWAFFPKNEIHGKIVKIRIGADFLRNNKFLLD